MKILSQNPKSQSFVSSRDAKIKEITVRLEQGIKELFESERYREYLKMVSKFHCYSLNNTLLIFQQKPDASLVAGFSAWQRNFKRHVKKGEKGIKIIAPYTVKLKVQKVDVVTNQILIDKNGEPITEEREVSIPAYKVVSVFDISQTEGEELPSIMVDELAGNVHHYKDFLDALKRISPVPIMFEQIVGGPHGYYQKQDKRIIIDKGMSELQTLKTIIHEIVHAKLHSVDRPAISRNTQEVQAESIAFTVCQHYGLDTSDYSFGYIATWSKDKELTELKNSLEVIHSTSAELINGISHSLSVPDVHKFS